MAAISSFPTIPDTMYGAYGTEVSYEASADITAGMIVKVSSGKIAPATAATDAFIGVALYDIPTVTIGAVRVCGVAKVANNDASTGINAGALVTAGSASGVAAASTGKVIGIALEAIAGGDTGLIMICPSLCPAS